MTGIIKPTKNNKNKHKIKRLGELAQEAIKRPDAHLDRKVHWKLFVRFKEGEVRKQWSWVDWWLVEDYLKRGLNDSFKRENLNSRRLESLYLKIQECSSNADQIIVYDKRKNKDKYGEDETLIEIVKNKVRKDLRPDSEKILWPMRELLY